MGRVIFSMIALAIFALLTPQALALSFKISPKEMLCFHEITHKGSFMSGLRKSFFCVW